MAPERNPIRKAGLLPAFVTGCLLAGAAQADWLEGDTATLQALAEMAEKDRLRKPLPTDPLTRAVLSNAAATIALLRSDWNALNATQRRLYDEIAEYARWDELPTPLLELQCCGTPTSWTSNESTPNPVV